MRTARVLTLMLLALTMQTFAQTPVELAEIWERQHISRKLPSNVRHRDLVEYLVELRKMGVKLEEVGRSLAGREIYQLEFGRGPLKVFMWSQMHGDEPTATSSLVDMFAVLQQNRDKAWVKAIEEKMTIRAVPMLNPDGAELYIRRSLQGIDINRDAVDLKTPEARLLKWLREQWQPDIGFNLHNQNSLTAVAGSNRQAAISFLVVYGDPLKTTSPGHERNKRLVGVMYAALNEFIPGYIGRYGDDWTPTAFGDNFSAWGTPTILVETGGLHSKDEMYLVKMNFVAFIAALSSIADGSEQIMSPANYDMIPSNAGGRLVDVVFRGATIVDRSRPGEPATADIGITKARRRADFPAPGTIRSVGKLNSLTGLDEYDASGFNVVGRFQAVRQGSPAELLFYRKGREIDWSAADLETRFKPDAIFSQGSWLSGAGTVKAK